MRLYWFPLLAAILFSTACNRGVESKEAVRQAIIDHLSSRSNINIAGMQVEVTSVSFRGNEADASVSFRAKDASGGGMTINYQLEKQNNRWVVKSKTEAGGAPHGSMGGGSAEMPPGHPPVAGKEQPGPGK